MPAQIRPNRLEVTDRFPMLAFSLTSSDGPRIAEVVLASDLSLFTNPAARNSGNFYSSREHGALAIPANGSVFTVPPLVLARFIAANRIYFGLATASAPGGQDWRIDVMPGEASPYVSLSGLTDRALRRVRMFPVAPRGGAAPPAGGSGWIGDTLKTPEPVAAAPSPANAAPAPAPVPYNDGFGPLEPLAPQAAQPTEGSAPPAAAGVAPAAPAVAAQGLARSLAAGDGTVATPKVAASLPRAEDKGWAGRALETAATIAFPPLAGLRAAVEASGYTIGVGPAISAGLEVGGALGTGIILAPGNIVGVYGAAEFDVGLLSSIGAQMQLTIVNGGIAAFNGVGFVAGISGGEGITGGAAALFDAAGTFCGVTLSVGVGVGLEPVDIYVGVQRSVATQLGLAQGLSRGFSTDPEDGGIDCSGTHTQPLDEGPVATAAARGLALTAADYTRTSRIAPSPAFTAGRSGSTVDRIVIHITDGPSTTSAVNTFTNPSAQASAHYLVGQDGEIVQFVNEADTAWHAGNRAMNRRSIGIEHVAIKVGGADYPRRDGTMQHFDALPPTQLQYEESALLVSSLCEKYGLPKNRTTIIGHNEANPTTSHSVCPTGNWDWDYFMRIVETGQCQADPPASQGLALAYGQSLAKAMADGDVTVSSERVAVTPPATEEYSQLRSIAIQALIAANPTLLPMVVALRAAAEISGYSIGIGPHAGAGLLGGAGFGFGLIFAPGNRMGAYGGVDVNAGLIAGIGAQVQVTIINGGIDAFGGVSYAAGISGGELYQGGAAALFDENRNFNGVQLQVGVGVGLSPVEIFTGVQRAVSTQLGIAQAQSRAFSADPEDGEISGPVNDMEPSGAPATASALDLTAAEYPGATVMVSPNFTRGRAGQSIDRIVIHITSSGQSPYLGSWFQNPESRASSHYMVDQLGVVRQFVSEADTAWHAGNRAMNRRSIGIEHVAVEQGGAVYGKTRLPYTPPSDIEYSTSAGLVASLCRKYGLTPDRTTIIGHAEANPATTHTSCPNGAWDWDRYMGLVSVAYAAQAVAGAVGGAVDAVRGAVGLGADDWSINWDEVESIAQPTDMGCWATSAAMITGWRDYQSVDPTLIARYNGLEPSMQSGLSAADTARFVPAVGMEFAPAACYTPEGFRDLIERYGPLFIVAEVPGLHAIVVTGMYRKDGQYYVRITDPWDRIVGAPGAPGAYASTHVTGSRYILTYDAFAAEYEAAAGFGEHQIAHGGSVGLRQPNRGPGAPSGYAQGLGNDPVADVRDKFGASPGVVGADFAAPSQTRQTTSAEGRSYDLAQLAGMVRPANALAGGAGMPPIPGQRVVLNEWPYVDEPAGRTNAPVAIDWKFDGAAVGEVSIVPEGGAVFSGRTVQVRADIEECPGNPNRAELLVRVITTFAKAGEPDEVATSEVLLGGDGMTSTRHVGSQTAATPAAPTPAPAPAAPAPQPAMA